MPLKLQRHRLGRTNPWDVRLLRQHFVEALGRGVGLVEMQVANGQPEAGSPGGSDPLGSLLKKDGSLRQRPNFFETNRQV